MSGKCRYVKQVGEAVKGKASVVIYQDLTCTVRGIHYDDFRRLLTLSSLQLHDEWQEYFDKLNDAEAEFAADPKADLVDVKLSNAKVDFACIQDGLEMIRTFEKQVSRAIDVLNRQNSERERKKRQPTTAEVKEAERVLAKVKKGSNVR